MIVRQAGGVVLLGDQVVLRLTRKGEYLFPKGHVDPGETPEQTVVREVAEETGLEAAILARLGETSFSYLGDEYQVTFFLMRATKQLPEWTDHLGKDVVVVPVERVGGLLSFESYREIWDEAQRVLRSEPGGA